VRYGADSPIYLENSAALYTLVQVIKTVQSIDPTVVKTKWESMDNVIVAITKWTGGWTGLVGIQPIIATTPGYLITISF
jgi:hypothetical protein